MHAMYASTRVFFNIVVKRERKNTLSAFVFSVLVYESKLFHVWFIAYIENRKEKVFRNLKKKKIPLPD